MGNPDVTIIEQTVDVINQQTSPRDRVIDRDRGRDKDRERERERARARARARARKKKKERERERERESVCWKTESQP